jgi:hypothetical protein
MDQQAQGLWYVEHRIEYLQKRQEILKVRLEPGSQFDYIALEEYMLNKGALKELNRLLVHLDKV